MTFGMFDDWHITFDESIDNVHLITGSWFVKNFFSFGIPQQSQKHVNRRQTINFLKNFKLQ